MKKLLAALFVGTYMLSALPVSAVVQLNPDGTVKTEAKKTAPKKRATTKKKTTPKKKTTTKKKTTPKKKAAPKKKTVVKPKKDEQANLTAPGTDSTSAVIGEKVEPKAVYDNGAVTPPEPENKSSGVTKNVTIAGIGASGALAIFMLIKKLFLH